MKNFIQPGRVIPVIAPYDVLSGAGAQVGTLFGIACHDALAGAPLELATEGVFEHPKTSAQAWTQGAAIYWDDTNKVFTTAVSTNLRVGSAVEAAANPSGMGKVRLSV